MGYNMSMKTNKVYANAFATQAINKEQKKTFRNEDAIKKIW